MDQTQAYLFMTVVYTLYFAGRYVWGYISDPNHLKWIKERPAKGPDYKFIDEVEREIWGPPISELFDEFVEDMEEFREEIANWDYQRFVGANFDDNAELLTRLSCKWSEEPIKFPQPEGAYDRSDRKKGSNRRLYTHYVKAAYDTTNKKERRRLLDRAEQYR